MISQITVNRTRINTIRLYLQVTIKNIDIILNLFPFIIYKFNILYCNVRNIRTYCFCICVFAHSIFYTSFFVIKNPSSGIWSCRFSIITGVMSFKAYVSDVIGRQFENLKKGHRSEVQMSVT